MKKLVKVAIIAVALSTSFVANARQGQVAAGGGLFVGGNYRMHFGPCVMFQVNITDPIRLEGSFMWSFQKSSVNVWGVNLNAHYLFPMSGTRFTLYPLAGLGWFGYRSDDDVSHHGIYGSINRPGFNVGGGIDLALTQRLILNFEASHKFVFYNNLPNPYFISMGLVYRF